MTHPLGLPPGPPTDPSVRDPYRTSVFSLFSDVLRRRVIVQRTVLLAVVLAAAVALLRPRTYTSTVSFVPQARRAQASALSGIAAQFGIAVGGDGTQSPDFYISLVKSRQLMRAAVQTRYRFATDSGAVDRTLVDVYRPDEATPALREDAALRRLERDVKATAEPRTGVISVAVRARNPELARAVAQRLVTLLNEYNVGTRRSQATAEREFTARALDSARVTLRRFEEQMQSFLVQNRAYASSPGLALQFSRLSRQAAFAQQSVAALVGAYEQARIEEVRDTPVISIVEPPEVPVRRDPRRLALSVAVAIVGGTIVGSLIALVAAHLDRLRAAGAGEFLEFSALRRETWHELARPHRSIARVIGAGGGAPPDPPPPRQPR